MENGMSFQEDRSDIQAIARHPAAEVSPGKKEHGAVPAEPDSDQSVLSRIRPVDGLM